MAEYGKELSHFEVESSKTPTKQPYAIIGGAVLLLVLAFLISHFAPTEAVDELKSGAEEGGEAAAAAGPSSSMDDEDEL
ncbi:MAG: hypothetical protein JRI23_24385 [Deltaproteobacteria bacterium]|jgi:hypothetical protein|nr:hypothetical protein [Deltaproteobacteria bacterium]MBW2535144.1 hypothetical protein [Deltaproteobacteria bacterium]